MPTITEIYCEACGRSAEDVLIFMTFSKECEQVVRCEMCERLVKEGILRVEYDDGKRMYRRWQLNLQPMTPTDHAWPAFSIV
jgi:uncharacterized Zn finger protein